MIPQRAVESVWDLGCGSGAIALAATTFAQRVVATDIDERALQFTSTNATANGVNIDAREGSLFEPVRGERFDLIVSNPPFVIGGVTELVHRESPFAADGLTRELLKQLPDHLNSHGMALFLTAWLVEDLEQPFERIEQWLPESGICWVGLRDIQFVEDYVETWLRDAGKADDHELAARWRAQLADWSATHVAFGVVLLNSVGVDEIVLEDIRQAAALPTGEELLEHLAAIESAHRLTAVEVLTREFTPQLGAHWRGDVTLDPVVAAIRAAFAEHSTAPEVAEALAQQWSVDEDDVLVHVLAGTKQLVAWQLLA
jgi:methylase of polypeptide subunit release factors